MTGKPLRFWAGGWEAGGLVLEEVVGFDFCEWTSATGLSSTGAAGEGDVTSSPQVLQYRALLDNFVPHFRQYPDICTSHVLAR